VRTDRFPSAGTLTWSPSI